MDIGTIRFHHDPSAASALFVIKPGWSTSLRIFFAEIGCIPGSREHIRFTLPDQLRYTTDTPSSDGPAHGTGLENVVRIVLLPLAGQNHEK
jgi:hypothetical protein